MNFKKVSLWISVSWPGLEFASYRVVWVGTAKGKSRQIEANTL